MTHGSRPVSCDVCCWWHSEKGMFSMCLRAPAAASGAGNWPPQKFSEWWSTKQSKGNMNYKYPGAVRWFDVVFSSCFLGSVSCDCIYVWLHLSGQRCRRPDSLRTACLAQESHQSSDLVLISSWTWCVCVTQQNQIDKKTTTTTTEQWLMLYQSLKECLLLYWAGSSKMNANGSMLTCQQIQ